MRSSISWLLMGLLWLHARAVCGDTTDDLLRGEMESHRIPGVALMVIRDGQSVKTAAYGLANLEWRIPVTPETVFEIGSLTKQFTAACILLLAQEGRLSVDDRLTKHLLESPSTWSNVTLRHLLTHTSGIKSYTGLDGFELTEHLTRERFIRRLAEQPVESAPGEKYKYCNSGYSLLGYVIEAVSRQSYWEFLEERIFWPLGMKATTDRNPRRLIPNRAAGYEWTTNKIHQNRDYDLTDVFAAGAIVSTVGDLAKWSGALDGETLLTADSKVLMWTPGALKDGTPITYGFGWRIGVVEGRRRIGHSGSTSGFSASFQRYPRERLTVIVLTNTEEQIATELAEKAAAAFLREE